MNQPFHPESERAPRVSVIIPAYNAAPFIQETLNSVFAQTFKDFEVIVINDGSPDSEEFERAIQPYRGRIVYLKQENRGPSAARNAGIRQARGEYIAFLDSDDDWMPQYLAAQMKLLEQTPSLDLVYCDVLHYSESDPAGEPYMRKCPSVGPVTFESLVMEKCAIPTSNAVFRRQIAFEAGLLDERFRRGEDYDLWIRMAHHGAKMAFQEKVLGRHRVWPQSLASDHLKMLRGMVDVLSKLEITFDLSSEALQTVRRKLAQSAAQLDLEQGKAWLDQGRIRDAADSFQRANRFFRKTSLRFLIFGLKIAPRLTSLATRAVRKPHSH